MNSIAEMLDARSQQLPYLEAVSEVICRVENETWAGEFSEKDGEKIDFESGSKAVPGGWCLQAGFSERRQMAVDEC